jgi:hypothetical protein
MSEYQRKARLSCLCYRALQGYGGNFPHTLYLGVIWSSWSAKRRNSFLASKPTHWMWLGRRVADLGHRLVQQS